MTGIVLRLVVLEHGTDWEVNMGKEKAIDKIMRLLELSKSENVHEASLAAMRAQELMERHKLHISDIEADNGDDQEGWKPGPINEYSLELGKVAHRWAINLLSTIAYVNQCSMCFYRARQRDRFRGDAGDPNRPARALLLGREEDIRTVLYMYRYLFVEITRLCEKEHAKAKRQGQKTNRSWTNSFRIGAVVEISGRLKEARTKTRNEAREAVSSDSTSLMRVDQLVKQMDDWAKHVSGAMNMRHNIKKGQQTQVRLMEDAFNRGKVAAKQVDLGSNTQIGSVSRQRQLTS